MSKLKGCGEKVKFEKGFLTRLHMMTGVKDFIPNYEHLACGEKHDACGSAGCLTQVFASLPNGKFANVLNENVQDIKFNIVRGQPAMVLELHGTFCGETGADPCGPRNIRHDFSSG